MRSTQKKAIEVYCDGLCEPNPRGVATYGFSIRKNGKEIKCGCDWLGEGDGMTNNVAEYNAVIAALTWLRENNLANGRIVVKSDSQLLINQLGGKWRVLSGRLLPLYKRIKRLTDGLDISYQWVVREKNRRADFMSRVALDCYLNKKNLKDLTPLAGSGEKKNKKN